MNTSLSIFARALASENISFSFDANAATASFDVENRHLVMPVWKVSETVQTMLVAHEISHALWTPYEQSKVLFDQAEAEGFNVELLQRIANVIEDVRIEKKMKDKFPGTRRDFFLGYKEINDLDMFGIAKMDLTDANIVNKVNIHFKWGVPGFVTVPMDENEQAIVDAVDGCETFEECIALAKIIYQSPQMQSAREKAEQQQGQADANGTEAMQDGIVETDIAGHGKKSGPRVHSPTVVIPMLENVNAAIVPTDYIFDEFERQTSYPQVDLTGYRQFVKDSDSFVRQLVMQFERRKAADAIRKERPKQTGQLNLDRLHQYRTHDDIFLSKIVKQDGKNHGIVFLMDFSGSMQHSLSDCFLQVCQLVWFCEKAKIPFEVFGYTEVNQAAFHNGKFDEWRKKNPAKYYSDFSRMYEPKIIGQQMNTLTLNEARLINIASSRDGADKREKVMAYLYESIVQNKRPAAIRLGGTPTVEAVAIASQFVAEWIKANNIQIPTLMHITDGSPNGIGIRGAKGDDIDSMYSVGQDGVLTVQNNITGTITRMPSREMTSCLGNEIVGIMLDSLREKFNARLVGMMVGPNALTESFFYQYCVAAKERGSYQNLAASPRFAAAKEAYKDGCIVVHDEIFHGYDAYFLVKTPKIVKDEDAIAESGTFTKVKNTFVKTMAKRSGSRVFLSRYVDIVAGQPLKRGTEAIYNLPCK
jgi:hypothetical protein